MTIMKKQTLANIILAAGMALSSGCVSVYDAHDFKLPKKVECSKAARCAPVDKLVNIPIAAGMGLKDTYNLAAYDAKETAIYAPIVFTKNMIAGTLNTTIDTSLNAILWAPLEVYEACTGKTFDGPYMPMVNSMTLPKKSCDESMKFMATREGTPENRAKAMEIFQRGNKFYKR